MKGAPATLRDLDEETRASLRLWLVLMRCHHALQEHARRDVERHGLGVTDFAVLEALLHRGPLTVGGVGERVRLTSGSTTYTVDKLERQGLIRRLRCDADRRVTFVELTPEGRARIEGVFAEHAAAMRGAMRGLTLEEKRIATALVRRLGLSAREQAGAG